MTTEEILNQQQKEIDVEADLHADDSDEEEPEWDEVPIVKD